MFTYDEPRGIITTTTTTNQSIQPFNDLSWIEVMHQQQQEMHLQMSYSPPPATTDEKSPVKSPLMDNRSIREALMSSQMKIDSPQQLQRPFTPMGMGFEGVTSDGLSALSVVGSMMMKHEATGGAGGGGGGGPQGFGDFDYMNMMQPIHLAAIGRHGSERHLSTESAITQAPAPVPTAKRSRSTHDGLMKCQFCPKKVDSEATLERHQVECRMIRPHECDRCGKRFKARGGLQQHMRIHNNDKAYTCQFCTKTFTQKSHLDQHERIHTGQKPFMCSYCGRAFRQRSQQMGHEGTHVSHFSSSSHTPTQGGQTTPSSSSSTSSGSSGDKNDGSSSQMLLLHQPTPPTPSPEQQQQQLNMAAAMMQMQHTAARQHHEISSLLGLHEFQNLHGGGGSGGGSAPHHQFSQSAAEATANGMRMLSHIAS